MVGEALRRIFVIGLSVQSVGWLAVRLPTHVEQTCSRLYLRPKIVDEVQTLEGPQEGLVSALVMQTEVWDHRSHCLHVQEVAGHKFCLSVKREEESIHSLSYAFIALVSSMALTND